MSTVQPSTTAADAIERLYLKCLRRSLRPLFFVFVPAVWFLGHIIFAFKPASWRRPSIPVLVCANDHHPSQSFPVIITKSHPRTFTRSRDLHPFNDLRPKQSKWKACRFRLTSLPASYCQANTIGVVDDTPSFDGDVHGHQQSTLKHLTPSIRNPQLG